MKTHLLAASGFFFAAAVASVNASPITITNADFSSGETGWTVVEATGEADSLYIQGSGVAAFGNVAHLKDGIGNATSLYLEQNLSTANAGLTGNTYGAYSVSFDIGWRGDNNAGDGTFLVSLINANGGATLASQTYTLATANVSNYPGLAAATPGVTFNRIFNLNYDNTAVSAGDVLLRIARTDADTTAAGNNYFSTAWLDNVAVNATAVPEPSTYGLLGAGSLAAVAMLRRRRARGA